MEGASHISGAHRKLFYKRFYRGQIVDSLNKEGVIETGETQAVEFRTNISTDPNYSPPSTSMPSPPPTPAPSSPSSGGSSGGGGY